MLGGHKSKPLPAFEKNHLCLISFYQSLLRHSLLLDGVNCQFGLKLVNLRPLRLVSAVPTETVSRIDD